MFTFAIAPYADVFNTAVIAAAVMLETVSF